MTYDFAAARHNMVESQVRPSDVTDYAIHDAMRATAREAFCPPGKSALAYADMEVEYAPGRHLMRPRDLAKLLQTVEPRSGEHALAIAAPYAAAVLEAMGLTVVRHDDGDLRAPPAGPFDVVVSEGAVDRVPDAWLSVLADGGRLGVVERSGPAGSAMLYVKSGEATGGRPVFDSAAPLLPEFIPATGFAF